MLHTSFFRLVTLKIPGIAGAGNVGTNFEFPDIGDLRYARTQSIESYSREDLAYSFPEPTQVIPLSQFPLVTLIFNSNDPDKTAKEQGEHGRFSTTIDSQRWVPLVTLHPVYNGTTGANVMFNKFYKDLYIVWQKSQANIAPGGLANTTDQAIVLGIYYTFTDIKGIPYQRT
jgi:hypothetical protein